MAEKIGMAIVDVDGKIIGEDDYEKWKEEMERVRAIFFKVINDEHNLFAEDGKKEYCGGAQNG